MLMTRSDYQYFPVTGNSHRQIARRMGVSARATRKLLRRRGWKELARTQTELSLSADPAGDPNRSAFVTTEKEPSLTSPRSAKQMLL